MSTPTPSPLNTHLAESIHRARRRYRKRLARCQKKFSENSVHDLRVETRRILALLDLLKTLKGVGVSDKLVQHLKKRLDQFGDLRDTQVQLELLKPLWPKFAGTDGLRTFLQRREKKLVLRLAKKIEATSSDAFNHPLKGIEKCLRKGGLDKRSPTTEATHALQKAFHGVVVLRREIQSKNSAAIHRMRIAFKRFRYLGELLQPVLPQITDAQLARMREYQSRAGAVQDLEVLLARIAHTVKDRKVNPAALRDLRNELLQRKHRATDLFMSHVDDLLKFQTKHRASRQTGSHS